MGTFRTGTVALTTLSKRLVAAIDEERAAKRAPYGDRERATVARVRRFLRATIGEVVEQNERLKAELQLNNQTALNAISKLTIENAALKSGTR